MTLAENGLKPLVIDGQRINVGSLAEAVERSADLLRRGTGFTLFTLNLDHLVKRRHDPTLRSAYERATLVTVDGAPIVALARRRGMRIQRAPGADLLLPICRLAEAENVPVFLFGGESAALARGVEALRRKFPGLDIRGTLAPSQPFDPFSPEADAAGAEIARSGARLCFVLLGAPRQELFSDRMHVRHPGIGFLCFGAALDFIAGSQTRAPRFMRYLGCEWLWRLAGDPRRLGARYLRCAMLLARLFTRELLGRPERDRPADAWARREYVP